MNDSKIILLAVGDVLIAKKDWKSSLAGVEDFLRQGDISFFNCETPYAETGCPGMAPHGAGPHAPEGMLVLSSAGFNVCTLANNHTMDWGLDAIVECRERLEALGVAVCGAGRNIMEARKPAIVEKKGVKVAFLGYNSVGPNWSLAEENKPGCAMVRVHTLYEPYDYQPGTPHTKVITRAYGEDLQAMVEDIKRAKKEADLVVMTDHWGVHYEQALIPDYGFEVGHAAIDAGADLILGTSTHILKGIEVYKGKIIAHSLANFCMENFIAEEEGEHRQMKLKSLREMRRKLSGGLIRTDQTRTIILKCLISGGKIERVSYLPVMMDMKMANPQIQGPDDQAGREIFRYMDEISHEAGLPTVYLWDGNEVVVQI